jgi:hypothetical protein
MKVVTRRVSGGNCFWGRGGGGGRMLEIVGGRKQEQIHGAYEVYRPERLNCWREGILRIS